MKSGKQIRKMLESGWADEGEKVRSVLGDESERGHVGATVGGRLFVPYRPSRPVREIDVEEIRLPNPTAVVQEGRFYGDEWVHDPAIRGWVYAASADQLAVQCADHLAAAGQNGWFVVTDQRQAVVVEADVVAGLDVSSEPEESKEEENAKGFGRFLGKARSAVAAVSEFSDNFKSGAGIITLWECSSDRITDGRLVTKGRSSRGFCFSRNEFVDGSVIEVRTNVRM